MLSSVKVHVNPPPPSSEDPTKNNRKRPLIVETVYRIFLLQKSWLAKSRNVGKFNRKLLLRV